MYNLIYPCISIKKSTIGFVIIIVYVEDLNLIQTFEELTRIIDYLKRKFEMKNFGETKFFLVS